jgi:hypothetical protein
MGRNFVCAECGGTMQMGIIVGNSYGPNDASYWMEGINEKGLWTGSLKIKGKKKHYISALRCETCGFLKFYAGPDLSESK